MYNVVFERIFFNEFLTKEELNQVYSHKRFKSVFFKCDSFDDAYRVASHYAFVHCSTDVHFEIISISRVC